MSLLVALAELISPYSLYLLIGAVLYYIYCTWIWAPPISNEPKTPRPAHKIPYKEGATQGRPIPLVNPATGDKMGEEIALTPEQVEEAVARARQAQKEWRQTSFAERRRVLADLLESVVRNAKAIADASVKDTGKTRTEAILGEVLMPCEKLRWLIRYGEEALNPEPRRVPLLLSFVKTAYVDYWPLGVIGIIIPWNYPFQNAISPIAAAIFTGNAAVVKVSEWSTGSRAFYERIFREVLANRGHNPDLVQLIQGYGETGAALVKSKGIDHAFFIGSPNTGKRIMEAASANLTPVTLELGGKDPFIVFDDADFDKVLDIAVRSVFINNGQNCISAERLYIQEGIYDKFVKEMARRTNGLRLGKDCGCMTMPAQVDIVDNLVKDAVSKGAKILAGGKRRPDLGSMFFEPTILADVTHEMRIAKEETFGPVMLLFKFSTEEEVIKYANDSAYGLSASVFTTDPKKAERVAAQIETGMLCVNDWAMPPLIQSLPFGGCKLSGFGRFNGPEGLKAFCRQRSIVKDRFPFLRTDTPSFLKYPIPEETPEILNEAIQMVYSRSWSVSLAAGVRFMKKLLAYSFKKK